ncbi:MAG: ABC-2 transporter permease [Lachnospiraceae bacterium]|nr:ABC-2 transporter permease [Lachnospiraceae bacterium]
MAGLIRKDMYCLKKILKTFFIVTISVIVLSVLFIISSKYGNIAKGIEEMRAENELAEETFYSFFQMAVWLTLFIPISFLSMVVECFKEDKKAGFAKIVFSMPLDHKKIVGSRYLSCMLFAAVSLAGSLLAGFFVSLVSEVFKLQRLFGYIFCFSAALLIYMSFVMFMLYFLGVEKADFIQCAPFVILFVAAVIWFQRKVFSLPEAEMEAALSNLVDSISEIMTEKSGLLFLIALGCMALSFWGSCKVVKKRKGDI